MNHQSDFSIQPLNQTIDDDIRRKRLQRCGASGFFKHAVPETLGGFGDDFQALVKHHHELGYHTHDSGLVLACNAHLWGTIFPLIRYGTETQQEQWLDKLINAELIGGHAITEAQGGSDPVKMHSTAVANHNGYLLNADKCYISNAPIADLLVVYVLLDKHPTAFLVSQEDDGYQVESTPIQSCRGASMGRVRLDHCQLEPARLLGKPGAGLQLFQHVLDLERAFIFAGIAGIMQWQLEQVIEFSRHRQSGRVHLGKHQAISHRIADIKLRLDTIGLWLNHCASLGDQQLRLTLAASQTKLYASEAFLQSSLDAVQIMGACGLKPDACLSELVTDALGGRLFSGSSEIQKNIIAALLGTGDGYKYQLKQ
ncbi:MAG: acyl-CoA dehydrogenase family protein [Gammaproteobacteria bacterium]|nr:acyl-CoA dehydrogenase family protein [Gammaproteobacteria bacterium]